MLRVLLWYDLLIVQKNMSYKFIHIFEIKQPENYYLI